MVQPKYRLFSSSEWIFILTGLAVAVPLIFFHLGHLPLRIWDEARLAINGYEMLQNHRWLVTTFEGAPDLWNTKPPLLIWLQVLSMKCFGIHEVAFRLPSALAVFLTCVLFYVFLRSYLKEFRLGFVQNMVLLTTTGLFTWHGGKNGDYDALLMLLCSAYCLAFFVFLEKSRCGGKREASGRSASTRYIYIFYLCLSLAILTKSSGALFLLPGLALYALLTGQFLSVLKNRHVYIGLLIPVVLVGGYYICREMTEPGYLRAVWENEFGGRFLTVIEEHSERPWFYIRNLWETRFGFWFFPAFGGAVFGLCGSGSEFGLDRRIYRLTLFAVVLSGIYLLLISLARTKCFWYDIALYPFLAVLAAVFVWRIFELLRRYTRPLLAYVFLCCLLASPVIQIYRIGYMPHETTDWEIDTHREAHYLRELLRHPELMLSGRPYVVVDDGYHAHHLFYVYRLRDGGYPVEMRCPEALRPGDVVICDKAETAAFLKRTFETELLQKERVLEVYDLKAWRTGEPVEGAQSFAGEASQTPQDRICI